jgi:hypothetical protein
MNGIGRVRILLSFSPVLVALFPRSRQLPRLRHLATQTETNDLRLLPGMAQRLYQFLRRKRPLFGDVQADSSRPCNAVQGTC